ncbi:GatB/YqeY domain-containing protein [Rhodoflexus caldus]|uniref:GatB/YqeY domain-containing protein n=1 Tax=Rhodoflexus caldus TaxID=2891236 RepID=UPI00202AA30A|nr:GatB/YqeY domain-containing protein [Rhodoflexus caldus]
MSLKKRIEEDIKNAMKAQDKDKLRALRAIKSLILLAETAEGRSGELTPEEELKLLVKAAKQRKDSAEIYGQQGRTDLQAVELGELAVIEEYLPKKLSPDELKARLQEIIQRVGAASAKDMGKVMGVANKELSGQADGKDIAATVKELLS